MPAIGPAINEWDKHRVIRKPAKLTATAMLAVSLALSFSLFEIPLFAMIMASLSATAILVFIWWQPSSIAEGYKLNDSSEGSFTKE
jgi:uncharacterized membrane protein YbaN (DUF454 family)